MLSNPFTTLSASVSPAIMQTYVVMMALLVVAGTLFDIIHKQSATYFFNNWRDFTNRAKRPVGGGEMASLAVQTAIVDVMASGEFCNMRRRIAHLLTMYGFVIYVVTTIMMVFAYPTAAAPTSAGVAALWYIGGLMVCAVQVLAHVLQARRRSGKTSSRSQRYDEQFAAACGRTGKIRWRFEACAALLTRPASTQEIKDTPCRPSFT